MPTAGQCPAPSASRADLAKLFSVLGDAGSQGRPISRERVRRLKAAVAESLDRRGRASPQLAAKLQRIERECRFTSAAQAEFQTLLGTLGLDSALPIQVPVDAEPSWFRYVHPLKQYRSHAQLPAEADVVIIGAGLTGASAAYHLRDRTEGLRVIVLDRGLSRGRSQRTQCGEFRAAAGEFSRHL